MDLYFLTSGRVSIYSRMDVNLHSRCATHLFTGVWKRFWRVRKEKQMNPMLYDEFNFSRWLRWNFHQYCSVSQVCTGADVEMITPGGEVAFVQKMIEESSQELVASRCTYVAYFDRLMAVVLIYRISAPAGSHPCLENFRPFLMWSKFFAPKRYVFCTLTFNRAHFDRGTDRQLRCR